MRHALWPCLLAFDWMTIGKSHWKYWKGKLCVLPSIEFLKGCVGIVPVKCFVSLQAFSNGGLSRVAAEVYKAG